MNSIIHATIILLLSLPAWAGTFKDNFDDDNIAGWKQYPNRIWEARAGFVVIKIPSMNNPNNIRDRVHFLTLAQRNYREYTLSCKVKVHAFGNVEPDKFIGGLAFRFDDDGDVRSYFAGINAWGLYHGSCNTTPEAKSKMELSGIVYSHIGLSFTKDKWYELIVKVNEANYSVILDDRGYSWDNCIFDDNHAAGVIPAGGVGLFAAVFQTFFGDEAPARSIEFHFDDFILTGEGILGMAASSSTLPTVWGRIKSSPR
jgi:hypothetical protein